MEKEEGSWWMTRCFREGQRWTGRAEERGGYVMRRTDWEWAWRQNNADVKRSMCVKLDEKRRESHKGRLRMQDRRGHVCGANPDVSDLDGDMGVARGGQGGQLPPPPKRIGATSQRFPFFDRQTGEGRRDATELLETRYFKKMNSSALSSGTQIATV
jgi:hypothetical protein